MPPASPATRARPGAVVKKLAPGAPGTRRLLQRYGSTLVCVRYREVEAPNGANRRLTTIELVIDERPTKPRDAWLRIAYGETELRRAVRQAGGTWDGERRLWRVAASLVKRLGLQERVVESAWIWKPAACPDMETTSWPPIATSIQIWKQLAISGVFR